MWHDTRLYRRVGFGRVLLLFVCLLGLLFCFVLFCVSFCCVLRWVAPDTHTHTVHTPTAMKLHRGYWLGSFDKKAFGMCTVLVV